MLRLKTRKGRNFNIYDMCETGKKLFGTLLLALRAGT